MSDLLHILVPEGRIAVERLGDGPAIVCVPGIGDWRQSYRHLAPRLVQAGYRVYLMDLRGHGDSDAGFSAFSARLIGEDILALLEAEDLTDACLVGCSIGGGAVAWAAAEAPDRVSRLVMLNPFVRDMPADRWMRPMVPLIFARPWGVAAWKAYRATLIKTPAPDHTDNEAALINNLRQPGRLRAIRAMMRASKADIAARLASLTQSTLIIMGAQDPDFADPVIEGRALSELVGGSAVVEVLDQVGHYPQTDKPAETAVLLLSFLSHGPTHDE
ncbi:MAG: pimeloyl-ACP methyl ester carboxylesterase [Kiritimatiellia bacterium]